MPIKPENKARYPENWSTEIVPRIRKRANNRCENCGIPNHIYVMPGKEIRRTPSAQEWDMINSRIRYSHSNLSESMKYHGFIKIICTVAHLDHQPENCSDENLKFWCQRCHNKYDSDHRKSTREATKAKGNLKLEFK